MCQVAIGFIRVIRSDDFIFFNYLAVVCFASLKRIGVWMNASNECGLWNWLRYNVHGWIKYVWTCVPHTTQSRRHQMSNYHARRWWNDLKNSRSCDVWMWYAWVRPNSRLPVFNNFDKDTHCWILFCCTTARYDHLEHLELNQSQWWKLCDLQWDWRHRYDCQRISFFFLFGWYFLQGFFSLFMSHYF